MLRRRFAAALGTMLLVAGVHAWADATQPAPAAPTPPIAPTAATPPAAPAKTSSRVAATDRLDDTFRKYAKRFFGPGIDWRLFKAQALAESGLDPNATSPVGARGIMQLMPSTFADVRTSTSLIGDRIDHPEWNIAAGILYDRTLWKMWTNTADDTHRWQFTFGSYNAGIATMRRAQKIAEQQALDTSVWSSIQMVAPDVPRWRHEETLTYVKRILDSLDRMNPNGKIVKK
jgi:membrane-bound lytic murein transglycosylase MltF